MLAEKTRSFIEKVALSMQESISIEAPNKYKPKDVLEFVEEMGCIVLFDGNGRSYYREGIIHLGFEEFDQCDSEDKLAENSKLKVLFHEIWHFISSQISMDTENDLCAEDDEEYMPNSVNPKEASANYFTRAMLLPEKNFVQSVIDNISSDGMCNVFNIAKIFKIDYSDVIARGNDLNLWNTKGGV